MGRPRKRLTSPERWEVTQLIKAGVLDVTEYPTFDEEGQVNVLPHAMARSSPCCPVLTHVRCDETRM